jgi:membrane protein implicated in regulation of membrane protease activity
MQKAGGIVALIAGIFGVLAAFVTLSVGGLGSAFNADDAQTVVGLGWGGLIFSFLTIILGAVCISSHSRTPGMLLVGCTIAGAVLGGTLVAIFMALAFVGGILAMIGVAPALSSKSTERRAQEPDAETSEPSDADQIIARHLNRVAKEAAPH